MTKTVKQKYQSKHCNNKLTFQDCELAILRSAVDEIEEKQSEKVAKSPMVNEIIGILEKFLVRKKCICYGGTAINNILPNEGQFYNKDVEIPDYDFYSKNALEEVKELANIYHRLGFEEVEAKAGVHFGTFKLYVNFIPIADITYLDKELFDSIQKDAILVDGILYAPPDFLRMSMFLELSRPDGDVSRWEKVLKRLTLLNQYYPLETSVNCSEISFQRNIETNDNLDMEKTEKIYYKVRDVFINKGAVFFGGFASSIYSKYMDKKNKKLNEKIPDFDVLHEDPELCSLVVKSELENIGVENVHMIKYEAIGELIPESIEIRIGKTETIAFVYKPIACHNYNVIKMDGKDVRVATIDTILSFYLAFYYTKRPYFIEFQERILCIAQFLFEVEEKNRLEQRGVLKRFSLNCYGKQPTIESIKEEKMNKYKELKNKPNSLEYKMWFLKYSYTKNEKKSKVKTEKKTKLPIRKTVKRTQPPKNREPVKKEESESEYLF